MLKIVERKKLKSRIPVGSVRVLKGGIRLDDKVIEEELRFIPVTSSRDTLYLRVAVDDEDKYWINISGHSTENSVRVTYNKHKRGGKSYVYYMARYTQQSRMLDGVNIPNGVYGCQMVKSLSGDRFRMLTYITK